VENINAQMTILDVVSKYRETEAVFKRYDQKAGACLCCEELFEPLWKVAEKYHLDLNKLMYDIEEAVAI